MAPKAGTSTPLFGLKGHVTRVPRLRKACFQSSKGAWHQNTESWLRHTVGCRDVPALLCVWRQQARGATATFLGAWLPLEFPERPAVPFQGCRAPLCCDVMVPGSPLPLNDRFRASEKGIAIPRTVTSWCQAPQYHWMIGAEHRQRVSRSHELVFLIP